MNELTGLGLFGMTDGLRGKQFSSRELTLACLEKIERENPALNAWITLTEQAALKQADEVDRRRLNGQALPLLAGVPYGLKDNICTKGVKTTCASSMLANFTPGYQAAAAERLAEAGAVLLGKLNMDEFAMGSANRYSAFGPVQNPAAPGMVPGGSSGGAAAAVAANHVPFALGSDTGGSLRLPAAFCGVAGLRPSYGRVSRRGLVAFASSMDQIGPIAKSTGACAAVLQAICGRDAGDATTAPLPAPDFSFCPGNGARGLRIGLVAEAFGEGLAGPVKRAVLGAAAAFEAMGAAVEEISLPLFKAALPAYCVLSSAQAASNLARYSGVGYGLRAEEWAGPQDMCEKSRGLGFGPEVKRRVLFGTLALSQSHRAYYQKALQVSALLSQELEQAFGRCDLLLTPTAPMPPWPMAEEQSPAQAALVDAYTVQAGMAGLPAITLPCGRAGQGPAGLQLMARAFNEAALLRAAYAYEEGGRANGAV